MSVRVPVTFVPAGVTVWVDAGTTVIDAARRGGVIIPAPCGGRGVCGKCGVKVLEGELEAPDEEERRGLKSAHTGIRLACRARIIFPVALRPVIVQGGVVPAGEPVVETGLVAAVDLGTTTVNAVIVGRASGRELGQATVPNAQQSFGGDVVSRIGAATSGQSEALRIAAEESVLLALNEACGRAGACVRGIDRLVIAGNSAMIALLAGADVGGLAHAPFAAPDLDPELASERIASELAPGAVMRLVPAVSAFVGGDLVAASIAAGLNAGAENTLLIDIGTNAEIAVYSRGRIVVASAAAGPAFEGYGVSCGGPAISGGIRAVRIEGGGFVLDVIGGGQPEWLTGSGIVSLIAALRSTGHLDASGLMQREGPCAGRFERTEEGIESVALAENIRLLQTDVRVFQSAKAAVAAGIVATLRSAGVKPRGVERVLIAGGFGAALDPDDLVELGVLPIEFQNRIKVIGDAALLGGATLAFDPSLEVDALAIVEAAHHVELASNEDFTSGFVAATALEPFRLKRGLFS
jgi:uncharacterized 2Fe-2S/4Fe-4S cluster protein (DUF4445 family)